MNFTLLSDELLSNSDRQLAFSGAKVNGIAPPPPMKGGGRGKGKGKEGKRTTKGYEKRAVYESSSPRSLKVKGGDFLPSPSQR